MRGGFAIALTLAAAAHAAAFVAWAPAPGGTRPGDPGPVDAIALVGVQGLLEAWDTPPEAAMPDVPSADPQADAAPQAPAAAVAPARPAPVLPLAPPLHDAAPPARAPAAPPSLAMPDRPEPRAMVETPLAAPSRPLAPARPDRIALAPPDDAPTLPQLAEAAPPPVFIRAPEAAPRPPARPDRTRRPAVPAAERPRPAVPASAPAQRATSTAPGPESMAAADPALAARAEVRWHAAIRAAIEACKRYPRAALGAQGEVVAVLDLSRDGRLLSVALKAGSGHAILDRAALDTIRAVGRWPRPDDANPGERFSFVLPLRFTR